MPLFVIDMDPDVPVSTSQTTATDGGDEDGTIVWELGEGAMTDDSDHNASDSFDFIDADTDTGGGPHVRVFDGTVGGVEETTALDLDSSTNTEGDIGHIYGSRHTGYDEHDTNEGVDDASGLEPLTVTPSVDPVSAAYVEVDLTIAESDTFF